MGFSRAVHSCTTEVIYVLSIFSLLLFVLLFSSFKTEVNLVIRYLRKPWRGGDSLPGTVQVQNLLQPGVIDFLCAQKSELW